MKLPEAKPIEEPVAEGPAIAADTATEAADAQVDVWVNVSGDNRLNLHVCFACACACMALLHVHRLQKKMTSFV